MRIQITKDGILVGSRVADALDILDVADDSGRRLVVRGHAVPYVAPDPTGLAAETAEASLPPDAETAEAGPRSRRKG